MSNALRRDIFDPENVRGFARSRQPQMLKMLTLLTYATSRPSARRAHPWKAENLWQLYISTANSMDRSVDEVRYHAKLDPTLLNRLRSWFGAQHDALRQFLEGFRNAICKPASRANPRPLPTGRKPRRRSRPARPAPHRQLFDLTVITRDRGRLFADVAERWPHGHEHRQGRRFFQRRRRGRR